MTGSETDLKHATAIEFLEKGILTVELDARQNGVLCPPAFDAMPNLRLNFAYRFGPNLTVNEWGIRQVLHFAAHGGHIPCAVPWAAVSGLISVPTKQGRVFAAPPEPTAPKEQPDAPGTVRRGHLRLVS